MIFWWFWRSGGHSGAILESDPKNTSKVKKSHSLFRRLFGGILVQNQILEHFCGIYFLAYFLHRFEEACGSNLLPFWSNFRRLLRSFCRLFCRCCKSVKLQPLSSETLVFKGARPPLLHTCRYFFACVFRHAVWIAFFADFLWFVAPNGIPLGLTFSIFCRFSWKSGFWNRIKKSWFFVRRRQRAGPPGGDD